MKKNDDWESPKIQSTARTTIGSGNVMNGDPLHYTDKIDNGNEGVVDSTTPIYANVKFPVVVKRNGSEMVN